MTLLTSCLDGTPDYTVPTRTPPVVRLAEVHPSVFGFNRVDPLQDEILFTVPFQSEDAGESIEYFWIRDFKPECENQTFIRFGSEPADPRPFEEQRNERKLELRWTPSGLEGCHSVTLLLTHESNVDPIIDVRDEGRAQRVTWWFFFENGDPSAQFDCFSVTEECP